jgi:hypothetical protein
MSAPSFVQVANSGSLTSSITVTYSSTPASGNLLLAVLSTRTGAPTVIPAGWSLLTSDTTQSLYRYYIYTKISGSSEPTGHTWTMSETNTYVITASEWSGAASSGAVEAFGFSGFPSSPQVTTLGPDRTIVIAGVTRQGDGLNPPSAPIQFGFAEAGSGGAGRKMISVRYEQATEGLTPTASDQREWISSANIGNVVTLAIAPASGPAASIPAIYYSLQRRA